MKVKSQVMSNIVRMLENEGPFKDVIYVILENVSKYLKMPDVTVMQYDEERTCLYPVLSYGGRHHLIQAAEVQAAAAQTAPQGTVERQVKAAADSPLYGEKLCYYRADTAQEPVRMALADANIKTSVTAPVKAEDKVRMYLCIGQYKRCRTGCRTASVCIGCSKCNSKHYAGTYQQRFLILFL
jgi:hypothetical protein